MRRTQIVTITDEGRDKGKTFILTEMPADQGERWATQALLLLSRAVGIPEGSDGAGMAGLAQATGVDVTEIAKMQALQDPSLESLWDCVRYVHKAMAPTQPILTGGNSQIEEIATRARLRVEVLKLHTGFFPDESTQTSDSPRKSVA